MADAKTILLVEDEALIAFWEKQILEKEGYRVLHVMDGETAIETVCARNEPVDLILMDINLGSGMDGTQAASQILQTHDVPIIFLSSHTEKEVVEKTEQITSYGYIVKNTGPTVMTAAIKMAFKLHEAHMQLRESEDRYRTVVESSTNSIGIHCEGKIAYVNTAAVKLFHARGPDDLIGLPAIEMVHPDDRPAVVERMRDSYENRQIAVPREEKFVTLDGQPIQVEVTGIPILYHGKPATQVLIRDITERKKAEEQLRKSEASFQLIFDRTSTGYALTTPDGHFLKVNSALAHMLGYSVEALQNCTLQDITHPDDLAVSFNSIRKLLESSEDSLQFEKRYIHQNGAILWAFVNTTLVRDPHGLPLYFITSITDITKRKYAEQASYESEKRYRDLFENAPLAIFHSSVEGKVLAVNSAFAKMFGYESLEDVYAHVSNASQIFADPNRRAELIRLRAENPNLNSFENLYRRKDGSIFWGRLTVRTLGSEDGRSSSFEGFIVDITEQRRMEDSLRDSENTLRAWLNAIHESALLIDREGIILMANATLAERVHHPLDKMVGVSIYDLLPPETGLSRRQHLAEVIASGQPLRFEDERFGRIIDSFIYPVFDPDGKVSRFAILGTDITERKQVEDRVKALLREKELVLKEVHHRIKNNMNTITSLLNLQADLQEDLSAQIALQEAASRVQSMMVLYDKLYRSQDFSSVSLQEYIPALLKKIIDLFPHNSSIRVEMYIGDIVLDPNILSPVGMILSELTTNAMKYAFPHLESDLAPEDGVITVYAAQKGEHVSITFEDNGIGLPNSFTIENSSGFGMQLVGVLVQQIRGSLTVQREKGTRFIIEFDVKHI